MLPHGRPPYRLREPEASPVTPNIEIDPLIVADQSEALRYSTLADRC